MRRSGVAMIAFVVAACGSAPPPAASSKRTAPQASDFRLQDLAKSDIDNVVEAHLEESLATVRLIAEKLYRRNPREWRKAGHAGIDAALAHAFDRGHKWQLPELGNARGAEAIQLAFRTDYAGNRVLAFSAGLASMIHQAYNEQNEFYLLDQLDPQGVYNAARNVEIAVWKLSTARDANGELWLLSNDVAGDVRNLSFEREFGKLIAYNDVLARVLAQRQNRTVRRIV